VLGVVFIRRLREGKTFEDFRAAWYPDSGFGVPSRVLSGAVIGDPQTVVTIGFVDAEPSDLEGMGAAVEAAEAARHSRIDEVIERTEVRTFFVVDGDDDFSAVPVPVDSADQGFPWSAVARDRP
jgi:hypothetical protein